MMGQTTVMSMQTASISTAASNAHVVRITQETEKLASEVASTVLGNVFMHGRGWLMFCQGIASLETKAFLFGHRTVK